MGSSRRIECTWRTTFFISIAVLVIFTLEYYGRLKVVLRPNEVQDAGGTSSVSSPAAATAQDVNGKAIQVPDTLLGLVYDKHDFTNEKGIHPTFWWDDCSTSSTTSNGHKCNSTRNAEAESHDDTTEEEIWGPCYAPHGHVDWGKEVKLYKSTNRIKYMESTKDISNKGDLADLCRPGFLIIGAGKCGTSSLYHYITDHPKVLPANEKQIHYFKYYANKPMKWYLKHFPTTTTFLAAGALMTGEASPGYLPYPEVANLIRERLPEPKIIAIGREPVDRAYSSYRYNYHDPTIKRLQSGQVNGIKGDQPDEYYEQYLYSFEEMIQAELKVLRECFADDGPGVIGARTTYGEKEWMKAEFERRAKMGEPPMVDLDGFCYGGNVDEKVPRKQWAELITQHPEKVIDVPNLHLVQSFVGRGLYTFPLEWWYALFPKEQIAFMCTEELSDLSGTPLNELGSFLGLPQHNFSSIVAKGAYNVGSHKGYDNEVPWTVIEQEQEQNAVKKEIPLSKEAREELADFIRPYNERLFALTGKRCNW